MAGGLRKTGIGLVGDVPWGSHFCAFYETKQDLFDTLLPYHQAGLEANESCILIVVDAAERARAREELRRAMPDLDRREANGDIEIVPYDELFDGGAMDIPRVLNAWNAKLAQALASGYEGLRIGGNAAWVPLEMLNRRCEDHFEHQYEQMIDSQRILALCCYPLEDMPAGKLFDVAGAHQFVIARVRGRWKVIETPELIQARQELMTANERLEQRVRQRTAELAEANAALVRAESQYRSIFENALEGIFQTGPDGTFLSVNPAMARVLGFDSPEGLIREVGGIHALHFVNPGHWDELEQRLQREGMVMGDRCEVLRKDGSKTWISLGIRSILDQYGAVLAYEGSVEDVAQRMALEDQLRQAQKMEAVGQLAGGVAHDFNNLLTVINGYAQLLLARTQGDELIEQDLQPILYAAQRAAVLTQRLLAFSRRQLLVPRVIDLNAVIRDLQPMLRRLLPENLEIAVLLAPDAIRVKADPAQVEQVILNLAVNSRDAMPDGGALRIRVSALERGVPPQRWAVLEVSDTGTGMDDATRERIFEPFFTTKEVGKGTGLGLAMVYGVVRQSGGQIEVESAPGAGATFRIYLPSVEQAEEDAIRPDSPAQPVTGHETILVVEDDDAVRDLVGKTLEGLGYNVLAVSGGNAALKQSAKFKGEIDLLISDLVMPGMSGRDVARRLARKCPRLKVLYISGYADERIVQEASAEPRASLLAKPFSPGELEQAVRRALASPPSGPVVVG
jgi:PAS domain S-box-containing protein